MLSYVCCSRCDVCECVAAVVLFFLSSKTIFFSFLRYWCVEYTTVFFCMRVSLLDGISIVKSKCSISKLTVSMCVYVKIICNNTDTRKHQWRQRQRNTHSHCNCYRVCMRAYEFVLVLRCLLHNVVVSSVWLCVGRFITFKINNNKKKAAAETHTHTLHITYGTRYRQKRIITYV